MRSLLATSLPCVSMSRRLDRWRKTAPSRNGLSLSGGSSLKTLRGEAGWISSDSRPAALVSMNVASMEVSLFLTGPLLFAMRLSTLAGLSRWQPRLDASLRGGSKRSGRSHEILGQRRPLRGRRLPAQQRRRNLLRPMVRHRQPAPERCP